MVVPALTGPAKLPAPKKSPAYFCLGRKHEQVYTSVPALTGILTVFSCSQVIRSLRSLAFLRPANAILVPGMYFLGFSR